MRRILLFNPHLGGHHLEYASRLQSELRAADSAPTVDFLAPAREGEHQEYFKDSDVRYLLGSGYDAERRLSQRPRKGRVELVRRAIKRAEQDEYDLIHFLQLDDLVREVHECVRDKQPEPLVTGSIIGAYFGADLVVNTAVSRLLRSRVGAAAERVLPEIVNDVGRFRNDQYMYRAMQGSTVDHTFVLSEQARGYFAQLHEKYAADQMSVVPDPTVLMDDGETTAAEARTQLNLPPDEFVALFFGQMRAEKGIHTLCNALKEYSGPSFTMVIAGSPTDLTEAEIAATQRRASVDVQFVPEFVPDAELPLYFLAADCVVCPYERSFGQYRTSGVFQRAAGSGCPVIAPAFGTFVDRVQKWELGTTFEAGSSAALAETLAEVVRAGGEVGDAKKRRRYAESQTYTRLAEQTLEEYRELLAGEH